MYVLRRRVSRVGHHGYAGNTQAAFHRAQLRAVRFVRNDVPGKSHYLSATLVAHRAIQAGGGAPQAAPGEPSDNRGVPTVMLKHSRRSFLKKSALGGAILGLSASIMFPDYLGRASASIAGHCVITILIGLEQTGLRVYPPLYN